MEHHQISKLLNDSTVSMFVTIVYGTNASIQTDEKLIFKNNVPFRSFISKISNTFIENSEGYDIVMPMLNLLEYSDNYLVT